MRFIRYNKSLVTVLILFIAASVFGVAMLELRGLYSKGERFGYLAKNLFLAWIPFGIAYVTYALSLTRKALFLVLPIGAFFWLIFFPNAPYILTDIQHLPRDTGGAPLWYDVMLLVWFAWTGLFLGIVSLLLIHEVVRREFGGIIGWSFVILVSVLGSLGIYMGRFLRWNSWDILRDPAGIAWMTYEYAQDPSLRSIGFTSLFAAFFLFSYLTLYASGSLLLERRSNQSDAASK